MKSAGVIHIQVDTKMGLRLFSPVARIRLFSFSMQFDLSLIPFLIRFPLGWGGASALPSSEENKGASHYFRASYYGGCSVGRSG